MVHGLGEVTKRGTEDHSLAAEGERIVAPKSSVVDGRKGQSSGVKQDGEGEGGFLTIRQAGRRRETGAQQQQQQKQQQQEQEEEEQQQREQRSIFSRDCRGTKDSTQTSNGKWKLLNHRGVQVCGMLLLVAKFIDVRQLDLCSAAECS